MMMRYKKQLKWLWDYVFYPLLLGGLLVMLGWVLYTQSSMAIPGGFLMIGLFAKPLWILGFATFGIAILSHLLIRWAIQSKEDTPLQKMALAQAEARALLQTIPSIMEEEGVRLEDRFNELENKLNQFVEQIQLTLLDEAWRAGIPLDDTRVRREVFNSLQETHRLASLMHEEIQQKKEIPQENKEIPQENKKIPQKNMAQLLQHIGQLKQDVVEEIIRPEFTNVQYRQVLDEVWFSLGAVPQNNPELLRCSKEVCDLLRIQYIRLGEISQKNYRNRISQCTVMQHAYIPLLKAQKLAKAITVKITEDASVEDLIALADALILAIADIEQILKSEMQRGSFSVEDKDEVIGRISALQLIPRISQEVVGNIERIRSILVEQSGLLVSFLTDIQINADFKPPLSFPKKAGLLFLSGVLLIGCVSTLFFIFTGVTGINSMAWAMPLTVTLGFFAWVSARYFLNCTRHGENRERSVLIVKIISIIVLLAVASFSIASLYSGTLLEFASNIILKAVSVGGLELGTQWFVVFSMTLFAVASLAALLLIKDILQKPFSVPPQQLSNREIYIKALVVTLGVVVSLLTILLGLALVYGTLSLTIFTPLLLIIPILPWLSGSIPFPARVVPFLGVAPFYGSSKGLKTIARELGIAMLMLIPVISPLIIAPLISGNYFYAVILSVAFIITIVFRLSKVIPAYCATNKAFPMPIPIPTALSAEGAIELSVMGREQQHTYSHAIGLGREQSDNSSADASELKDEPDRKRSSSAAVPTTTSDASEEKDSGIGVWGRGILNRPSPPSSRSGNEAEGSDVEQGVREPLLRQNRDSFS